MSSVPRQLATFAAVLAVLYAGGFAAGHIIDADAPGGHSMGSESHGESASGGGHAEAGHGGAGEEPAEAHGQSSTENGLRLIVKRAELRAGRSQDVSFTVLDESGAPVTDYDVTHTKRMHMILVRRDTTGFQHLHPTQDADGAWTTRARIPQPGSYRLYADFSHAGEKTTLAADLNADGAATSRPLPAPAPVATLADGYEVRIDADDPAAGETATVRFTVSKDGSTVETEPYLGAGGHLVALREGDLAYLHVHPTERHDAAVAFETAFPSAGTYRLFLQFRHGGRVHTAAFTHEVH